MRRTRSSEKDSELGVGGQGEEGVCTLLTSAGGRSRVLCRGSTVSRPHHRRVSTRPTIPAGPAVLAAAALLLAGPAAPLAAQPSDKQAHATRVTGSAPSVDGRLDDAAWRTARFFQDFVQKRPEEGGAPTERTEVAFIYDDEALYVGARL